jgi:hypothetical protein
MVAYSWFSVLARWVMASKVAKSVEFPVSVAAELEEAATANGRSLAAEVRVAVAAHLADRVIEATTAPSGFTVDDAARLGVSLHESGPARWTAQLPGEPISWGPGSLSRVLTQIEDWGAYRRSMGVVSAPTPIKSKAGTAGPSAPEAA